MSSKKKSTAVTKGASKKAKKNRPSVRDKMRAAKSGGGDTADKTSDPIGALDAEWWKNAKEADKWKPRWDCMQQLMAFASGDAFGNADIPEKFDDNSKANEVIAFFAAWLMDEMHVFTRQHILKLLIPFGNSFGKTQWKKSNKLAEALIIKQWTEKKHGFLPLVTPALIAVYIASGSQLKKWKEHLLLAMDSAQGQVRMSCWDFLAKICILSKQDKALKTRGPKDVELFINDDKIIESLKNTILNDKEKEVRDACAKFIYGAKQICSKIAVLDAAYKEILNDKRASMALDIAADLFNNDQKILSGAKPADPSDISKKVELKQARQKKKQGASRMSNMRAMIAAAKKEAAKSGGGGAIEVVAAASTGGGGGGDSKTATPAAAAEDSAPSSPSASPPPSSPAKKTSSAPRKSGNAKNGDMPKPMRKNTGMAALMEKYKKDAEKKQKTKDVQNAEDDDDDDEDEEEEETQQKAAAKVEEDDSEKSGDDSEDSEDGRERQRQKERERKKKERERQKREKEKERERKKKEREKEKERERARKERHNKRRKHKADTDSDEDDDGSDDEMKEAEDEVDVASDEDEDEASTSSKRRNKKHKKPQRGGNNKASSSSKASKSEIAELSQKIDSISENVDGLQNGMRGMERKMTDMSKANESAKSGIKSKTEEKIMKILSQLQKDVKILKNDISYIKSCWEDAESVPSDN
eukprot:CAMPEP_0202691904 /NCGR_PEP_ID=MMETSP1385-20130828/6464_1 /ASSEMBLY_ACC=CAM_ASM_000861 /TAXON_ID=933848 /ORGANISM="Elphidium margaritaceum" /LENGTH=698 /DNA_ID=CAMNT_0049347365 /DNA_START=45 /DNA_END=2141 /DNA_ORIENTATION=-